MLYGNFNFLCAFIIAFQYLSFSGYFSQCKFNETDYNNAL